MLSVFITPCTKPTRIQCATITAVRSQTSPNHWRDHVRRVGVEVREVAADAEVDQLLQQRQVAARGRQLEVAEAEERRRDPADDRAGLRRGSAVVEHVAHHVVAGGDQAQRARGRHAEVVHGLAAEELADRRAQHGAAVGGARIRRRARALELQLPALATGGDDLAQRDGAAVAQLPGPVAELMAAVVGRVRVHAGQQRVACEHLCECGIGGVQRVQPQQRQHFAGDREDLRVRHGRGCHARPQSLPLAPTPVPRALITRQRRANAIVEAQRVQPHVTPPSCDVVEVPRRYTDDSACIHLAIRRVYPTWRQKRPPSTREGAVRVHRSPHKDFT